LRRYQVLIIDAAINWLIPVKVHIRKQVTFAKENLRGLVCAPAIGHFAPGLQIVIVETKAIQHKPAVEKVAFLDAVQDTLCGAEFKGFASGISDTSYGTFGGAPCSGELPIGRAIYVVPTKLMSGIDLLAADYDSSFYRAHAPSGVVASMHDFIKSC
jgi:hypothetical protein